MGAAWTATFLARPFMAPLVAVAGVLLGLEVRRSEGWRRGIITCATVGIASVLALVPWLVHNERVAEETHQPFLLFQPLASRPPFTNLFTPEVLAWYRSYEEPLIWLDWQKPIQAHYLSQEEQDQVAEMWKYIAAHDGEVTPEMNAEFHRITLERYAKAPLRLYVWRPISMVLKYWLSPRVSTLRFAVDTNPEYPTAGRAMMALFWVLNGGLTALAMIGILRRRRSRDSAFLWWIPAAVTATLVSIGSRETRLVMTVFPLITIAAGVGVEAALQAIAALRAGRSEKAAVSVP
jgi:hypothetical protein